MLSAIHTPPLEPEQFKQPNIHITYKFSYIMDFSVLTAVSSVLPYQAGAIISQDNQQDYLARPETVLLG